MTIYEKIKDRTTQILVGELVRLAPRVSNKNIIRLIHLAEKIDWKQKHIQGIKQIGNLFEKNHPSIHLIRRLLHQVDPYCIEKLLENILLRTILLNSSRFDRFTISEGFHPPYTILISPTMRCNLRCKGCYAERYSRKDDLDSRIVNQIIVEAKEIGTSFFTVLGGEPFLWEELFDIFEKHEDAYFQVYSNGTMITGEVAEKLRQSGNVAVMLSLDGFENFTDARRGKGIFRKVMDSMNCLRETGVPFGFSAVVTRYNLDEITGDAFIDLVIEKGCLIGWYFLYMPVGGEPDLNQMPTARQRLELKHRRSYIRANKPLFIIDFWNDAPYVGGCIAGGHEFFHINSKGDVEPCIFIHLACDNIKKKSLKEILRSPFFEAFRKRHPYCQNLYRPCTIIDHPEILQEIYEEEMPYATCPGAEQLVKDPKIREGLKRYSRQVKEVYDKVWQEEDKTYFKPEGRRVDKIAEEN